MLHQRCSVPADAERIFNHKRPRTATILTVQFIERFSQIYSQSQYLFTVRN